MQDEQQTNKVQLTPLTLTVFAEKEIRKTASKMAYRMLKTYNDHSLKVTEDELRDLAIQEGTHWFSGIVGSEFTYGPADLSMPVFIEVYCAAWKDGGVIVSQVEKDAIDKAHQQKLKDAGPTYTDPLPDELMIQAVARKHATEYLLGETLTLDPPISQIPAIKDEITEDQRTQFPQFEQAYLKAYREYPLPSPPRKKLFGIF